MMKPNEQISAVPYGFLSSPNPVAEGWVDWRMVATIRLFIVSVFLFIVCTNGVGGTGPTSAVLSIMLLYTAGSVVIYFLATRSCNVLPIRLLHWIDLGFCATLMLLSGGTDSHFSFLLFLPLAIAAFRWGLQEGFRVLITSLAAYSAAAFWAGPDGYPLQFDRFLLRFLLLAVLGSTIVYWGASEITFKRRLHFLKEANQVANPRFGVDRTIALLLERLREFYDAKSCVLIMPAEDGSEYQLRTAVRMQPTAARQPQALTSDLRDLLLSPHKDTAIVYGQELPWSRVPGSQEFNVIARERIAAGQANDKLAALLEAESLLSVPVRCHQDFIGRLIVVSDKRHQFNESDADFILQFIDQVAAGIENIRLLDRMVCEAAEQERQKLALDIHDSVIQSSIGVQMGLSDIYQKIDTTTDVKEKIEQLIEVNGNGIAHLRHYMTGLRDSPQAKKKDGLIPAIERFAAKFRETAQIDVELDINIETPINDRLSAEVFQMVVEGLSNIRRHTSTNKAFLRVSCTNDHFDLHIENEGSGTPESGHTGRSLDGNGTDGKSIDGNGKSKKSAPFTPRSIMARAASLGGQARVKLREDGGAAVIVSIPL